MTFWDTWPIINQIRAETSPFFTSVLPALFLNDVQPSDLPIAFVYERQEQYSRSQTLGATTQVRNNQFVVTLATAHPFEEGQNQESPMKAARLKVYEALHGKTLFQNSEPIELIASATAEEGVTPDYLIWNDIYGFVDYVRSFS